MALHDSALVIGANAVEADIDGMRLHSGTRGSDGTTNRVGSLTSVSGTVDSDGDITWVVAFTGLPANQPVAEISYYSGSTYRGGSARGGGSDTTANAAGEYTATVTESFASA